MKIRKHVFHRLLTAIQTVTKLQISKQLFYYIGYIYIYIRLASQMVIAGFRLYNASFFFPPHKFFIAPLRRLHPSALFARIDIVACSKKLVREESLNFSKYLPAIFFPFLSNLISRDA